MRQAHNEPLDELERVREEQDQSDGEDEEEGGGQNGCPPRVMPPNARTYHERDSAAKAQVHGSEHTATHCGQTPAGNHGLT